VAEGSERRLEEVCSPAERPSKMALSSGGESAPLIRVRSVVRVHEGPPSPSHERDPRRFSNA
jgi:hypothetical protein